ncbi:UNVERIFIED_CONTAM: hypothetical protein PYX00_008664 [Menopon gallinae]|uniref:AAA+ ATPase domain-containing protein n=1 Tax=Menopon gallinae TaxID=328185 RepID=A0AAW2HP67_9NEOP
MLSELSYSSLKNCHQIREYEEKKNQERKRNILCLISQYLKDEGYSNTFHSLYSEAPAIRNYVVCDNIDLPTILKDYESYYNIRFEKYPKISKPQVGDGDINSGASKASTKLKQRHQAGAHEQKAVSTTKSDDAKEKEKKPSSEKLSGLTVVPLGKDKPDSIKEERQEKILKPLGGLGIQNPEWMAMAETITKDIVVKDLNVHWHDIKGLDEAKRLLKEAVVYPIKYPELFSGILCPWKGLLLFGPSGTGKTMLAKAVATECKTTFFNITSTSIISKWRGDSEKLVRVMFDLARYYAPSTIFIDEIDAIASTRDMANEHEASRRLKTELLIQLDGLSQSQDQVFFLATSNLPWELDSGLLRRLEKRILVGLPNVQAREALLRYYLPEIVLRQPTLRSNVNYSSLAKDTEGYSGSDIHLICKETAMQAIRNVFKILEDRSNAHNNLSKLQLEPITTVDVLYALERTKPSCDANLQKYVNWYTQFGSV